MVAAAVNVIVVSSLEFAWFACMTFHISQTENNIVYVLLLLQCTMTLQGSVCQLGDFRELTKIHFAKAVNPTRLYIESLNQPPPLHTHLSHHQQAQAHPPPAYTM